MSQAAKPDSSKIKPGGYLASVPPQEILPIIDSKYETSVKGIYVIGDATGFPLVKVAANQGRQVIERMAADSVIDPNSEEGLDLVIIGGGPAGISAAIEATKQGWNTVVLERNKLASTVRSFPPGKMVYAEPHSMANESELDVSANHNKEEFLEMIQASVEHEKLHVKEDTEVVRVRKNTSNHFDIELKNGKFLPCKKVIIAIGRQGQPRLLNLPGAEKSHKVTYRFHSVDDYVNKDVLIVGGGNSAIEAALSLCENNDVTLSYRGDNFYRAKEENRELIDIAADSGKLKVIFDSNVTEIREDEVDINVGDQTVTIRNDSVIVQIGTLPPIDFLHDIGIEMDGIWTTKRFAWAGIGIVVGFFLYFIAKHFVLLPEKAGEGRWYLPLLSWFDPTETSIKTVNEGLLAPLSTFICYALPIPWLLLLGLALINKSLSFKKKRPLYNVSGVTLYLFFGALVYYLNFTAPSVFTIDSTEAGNGPYHLPGFEWLFCVVPEYFAGLGGFYYLVYFLAITGFGLYWAFKINHPILWKRNLTIIVVQWTLWWGIPTFLVVFIGTNPWTPLLSRSINAWPLKIDAFDVDPSVVRPGDPEWWYTVAVVGVVWAVFLTFVIIPIFTIRFGKIYCSYVCSCGALAETVGNGFRHRGPKGDTPRRLERYGYIFVALAALATMASMMGFEGPVNFYNVWVGTFLAGALAIGLYPFLGQRIWCRMWCPLAFWMNFWGRWSKFKITPEKGKCIDCNICNQYCQMGIDIKSRALQGKPITLVDTPCIGCAECVMRCPMEILHLGDVPDKKLIQIGNKGTTSTKE